MEKKKFKINIHVVFGIAVVLMIAFIVSKFIGFGHKVTQEELDAISVPDNPEIEVYDNIIPRMAEDDGTFPEDDGVTTIVCLGNNPFSDDRGSENNICSMLAERTGATVYNCSIPNSCMTACADTFQPAVSPMDAFSFYFLTTIFANDNAGIIEEASEALFGLSDEIRESVDLLTSIDFRTVDVIAIMYDGTDYFYNRTYYRGETPDAPDTFTGSLTAGVNLIKEKFPWIRIVVVSPTYAFAVDEEGGYISSDKKRNGSNVFLSTYMLMEFQTAYDLNVSFVDVFYGGVHEDVASEYLIDNLHLNQKGRELVVDHMIEAIGKYTPLYGLQNNSESQ